MSLSTAQVLNKRYRIVSLLGQGGFGAVYRAWDLNLKRPFALKENLDLSPESVRQFEREAAFLAKLHHPNLPRVIDYFLITDQGQYLVMDFIEGETLEEKLDRAGGALPEEQVIPWIIQVCDALTFLHSQNPPVIHRDIKPANIKITPEGRAVLVDFGIAKAYFGQMKTTLGARAVTEGYSPPEQYGFGITDSRSDIYALGATLYHALTGQRPVESVRRSLDSHLPPPRTLNPNISPQLEAVVLTALDMDVKGRFQSAQEFKEVLQSPRTVLQPMEMEQEVFRQKTDTVLDDGLISPLFPPPPLPIAGAAPRPASRSTRGMIFRIGIIFGVVLCLLAGGLGGLWAYFGYLKETETPTPILVIPTEIPVITIPPGLTPTPEPTQESAPTYPPWTPTITSTHTPPPPTPTDIPTDTPTEVSSEWRPCPGIYASRLHLDDRAYVSYNPPLRNNVRSSPNLGASLVGMLDPGEEMRIIEGPICANNMVWWRIRSLDGSLTGWTSEGDMENYWLVPLPE